MAEHAAGQAARTVFQVFCMTRLGIGPSLPAVVARVQPTVRPCLDPFCLKRRFRNCLVSRCGNDSTYFSTDFSRTTVYAVLLSVMHSSYRAVRFFLKIVHFALGERD